MFAHSNLNNNQIKLITNGTFAGLGNLAQLYVTMHGRSIASAWYVTYLSCRSLSENQITLIADGAFAGLVSLKTLYATELTRILVLA